MKHFSLKFNHGVEIGAELAYRGHYKRVGKARIAEIIEDEIHHRQNLANFLKELGEETSPFIDKAFTVIGTIILNLCAICPLWSLDLVASSLEIFAVFNYRRLSEVYPEKKEMFLSMAECEDSHQRYFSGSESKIKKAKEKFFHTYPTINNLHYTTCFGKAILTHINGQELTTDILLIKDKLLEKSFQETDKALLLEFNLKFQDLEDILKALDATPALQPSSKIKLGHVILHRDKEIEYVPFRYASIRVDTNN